jgi:Zinc finger, C3HC4 type (RING finger)
MPLNSVSLPSVDSSADFGKLSPLGALDQSLRCPLCLSLYTAPLMITSCGHTFCAGCVRGYISAESKCPSCLEASDASKLRKVGVLEEVVQAWTSARCVCVCTLFLESAGVGFRVCRPQAHAGPLLKRSHVPNWESTVLGSARLFKADSVRLWEGCS